MFSEWKERTGKTACHDADADPGEDLEHVVWASDEVESIAEGNAALASALWTQGTQRQMRVEVGEFCELDTSACM